VSISRPDPAAPAGAPRRTAALLSGLAPLGRRDFGLLWAGGLVSIVGSWMQTVAVGALVTAQTGRATWAVLVAAGAFLPIGVLSPLGGALADRLPRRAALVVGNLAEAALAAVLAALVAAGRAGPVSLTLVVTVQGCVSALVGPFQAAVLPDLVPAGELLAASSLNSAQFNLGRVVGPALAGITIAAFGYPTAFVANAVSFLAVVIALAFVRLPRPAGRGEGGLWSSVRQGARAARAEPACRAAIGLIALVALFASPFIALVPVVARHVAGGGSRAVATATGVLTTAQGVGAVVGAVVLTPLAARLGRARVLLVDLALLPGLLVVYGRSDGLAAATVALGVVGFVYVGVLSGLSTVVQLHAPAAFRGRVLSLYLVALGVVYPLGSLLQGPLADRVGLAWTTGGAAGLLAVALIGLAVVRPGVFRALGRPVAHPGVQPSGSAKGSPNGSAGPPPDRPLPDPTAASGSNSP